jgi:hypothetical protein
MKSRAAVAQYEATIVLVVVSLSLASIVYEGLRRGASLNAEPVFVNDATPIGGNPSIERLVVNASSETTVSSFNIDEASSTEGVIAFDGSVYSTSGSLCAAEKTTLFSVYAQEAGVLHVAAEGRVWISGTWAAELMVGVGWHELMIQGGASCSVTLPGGEVVPGDWNFSSPLVSSIPVEGGLSGRSFTFYLPTGGGSHRLLLTATGGFDDVPL